MIILTIDQQIEAVEKIIRAGDKTEGSDGLMDELFGETNESRVEEAMSTLIRFTMMKTLQSAASSSSDSYERL